MYDWMKSKLLSTVILLSIAVLALGATRVVTGRSELSRRERLQVRTWVDWQSLIADDLPRNRQRAWRASAETSPEVMMRACSYRIEPMAAVKE